MNTVPRLRPAYLVSSIMLGLLLVSTGCFLDFDEFDHLEFDDVGVGDGDTGTITDTDPPDDDVLDEDADVDEIDPSLADFGEQCDEDDDCAASGVCRGNVCLTPCAENADCPDLAACLQVGTEDLCAPRCSDTKRCDHYDRDDLSCVYLVQTQTLGSSPHSLARACLTDSTDDGVFDGIDNCPDTQNPTQRDSTGDGVGDACSDTPFCHADSTEGILDFDSTAFRAGGFATAPVIDGRWLPVVGTVDEDGLPQSSFIMLDRQTGEWHEFDDLRFAGEERRIGSTNTGGFVITPGILQPGGLPVGAWTFISPDGEISYGREHNTPPGASYPIGGPLRFANGELRRFFTRIIEGDISSSVSVRSQQFGPDLSSGGVSVFATLTVPNSEIDDLYVHDLVQADGSLGHYFWHESVRQIRFFHTGGPTGSPFATLQQAILSIPDELSDGDEIDPVIEDLSEFDPFLVPAPGGQLYVFDKNTGRAGRFLSERQESNILQRTWNQFERLPEYDLTELDDFQSFSIYLLPDARGLGIVGRPEGEDDSLQVREIYFSCHPRTADLDTSGDGIGDFVDNCPLHDNPDQEDLDGDSWGDVCDTDTDGDGIPDVDDVLLVDTGEVDDLGLPIFDEIDFSRDSNNNGTDNEDDDDIDGDSIPNQYDPFPLDSSNNGTPNHWTTDASGNGYSDSALRNQDLDPYHFFSLPTGRKFAFLTEGSNGQRTLHQAAIESPRQSTPLGLASSVNPHQISYAPDGEHLVFLADEPGETDTFYVYDLEAGEVAFSQSVFSTLRSITMIDETTFYAVHERDTAGLWQVSRIDLSSGFSRIQVFSEFSYIWFADVFEDHLIFVGAETDCRECASAYSYHLETGEYQLLQNSSDSIEHFVTQRGMAGFITQPPEQDERLFSRIGRSGMSTFTPIAVDEHYEEITSVSISRYQSSPGTPVNNQSPFVMATMSRFGQTPDIWIAGGLLPSGWHLLFASNDSIVEAAWQP